jgi:hypothetical protein
LVIAFHFGDLALQLLRAEYVSVFPFFPLHHHTRTHASCAIEPVLFGINECRRARDHELPSPTIPSARQRQKFVAFSWLPFFFVISSTRVALSGFNIVVVDGTWTQAKKVARSLPQTIPYVRLMSTGHLAFKAPMRTQSEPDRICTLGAIIQLLSVRVWPRHRCLLP